MDQNDLGHRALTRQQKTGFVLLLIFGILAIGLGVLQLHNTVFGPFASKGGAEQPLDATLNPIEKLKHIDTDHDGLNDYDEVYIYHTSSYLADTDSDGVSDKTEIERGTDPLCDEKKNNCAAETLSATASPSSTGELISSPVANVATPEDLINQAVVNDNSGVYDQFKTDLQNPVKLREMLLATGKIATDTLSKIDDKSLMQMLSQLIQANSTSPTNF